MQQLITKMYGTTEHYWEKRILERARQDDSAIIRVLAETAASISRRSNPTTQGVGNKTQNIGTTIRQELKNVANKNDLWISDISTISYTQKALSVDSAESIVYLCKDGKNVIKLNRMSFVNNIESVYKFIDRLYSNDEFSTNYTAYQLLGFANDIFGEVCIVLKQPFIPNITPTTQKQINEDLTKRGFRRIKYGMAKRCWTNGFITIEDAKTKNVATYNGVFLYYDIITQHATQRIIELYQMELE